MKISLAWLADYLGVATDSMRLSTLARARAAGGRGRPSRRRRRRDHRPCLRTERHPDAAKVQRVWVDAGDGIERHVWCGASNFAAGDVVPLPTLGHGDAGRPHDRRRGRSSASTPTACCARPASSGSAPTTAASSCCPPSTPIGVPYGDVVGLVADVVLDLDVTRNRPDAHGYVGVARDLAAATRVAVHTARRRRDRDRR